MPCEPRTTMPLRPQLEQALMHAALMTEMGMDVREKCSQGDKYVCYLRSITLRAARNIRNLQATANQFLLLAQKLVNEVIASIDNAPDADHSTKLECEKLIAIIERELAESEDAADTPTPTHNLSNVSSKIKYLETKQKLAETPPCVQQSCSVKSVKSDVDEKYPENWSRDSLIDLNNVVNLPPVPEDIFTCFSNKPTRTSSLSSLKGMRKVKLFLQRAANNSDDEDSSDMEDHDVVLKSGDGEDKFSQAVPSKKHLGNIKEETQQD